MTIRDLSAKAVKYGVGWNVIKASYALGVLTGFVIMAVAMAGGQATVALIKAMGL